MIIVFSIIMGLLGALGVFGVFYLFYDIFTDKPKVEHKETETESEPTVLRFKKPNI